MFTWAPVHKLLCHRLNTKQISDVCVTFMTGEALTPLESDIQMDKTSDNSLFNLNILGLFLSLFIAIQSIPYCSKNLTEKKEYFI